MEKTTRPGRIDPDGLRSHRDSFVASRLTGPLLRWRDLTDRAQALLTQEFIAASSDVRGPAVTDLYPRVLHSWGVMCPHPSTYRLYGGERAYEREPLFEREPWFSCGLCRSLVVNRGA